MKNVQAVLEEYGQAVRNKYQDNLIGNDRIASGDLLNSVEYKVTHNGTEYLVQLTLQDYWKYIERGTSPHWPPVGKLLEWIKVKPVIPRPLADGRIPTQRQLAYLIGRKISEEGTAGSHDLEAAIKDINEAYKGMLCYALQQDCEQLMKVVVGEIQGSIGE